jgi:putative ABC transport system permease protein
VVVGKRLDGRIHTQNRDEQSVVHDRSSAKPHGKTFVQAVMSALLHDARYALRLLRRAPGFTTIAIAIVAIGIGANTAMFTLVDAALLRPLPFSQPEQLSMLWEHAPDTPHNRVAPLNFVDWSEQNHTFAMMAAVSGGGRTLIRPGSSPERLAGQAVTSAFFDVLGVRPLAGRTFVSDDASTRTRVVVISEGLWRSHFAAEEGLIGSTIVLDGQPFTVIGIVPAAFQIFYPSDLWTLYVPERTPEQRRMHYLQVVGRLAPGVSLTQARDDMAIVGRRIAQSSPDTNKEWGVTVEPLHDAIVGHELRTTSLVLAAVVVCVLLMACANVASLLLARGIGRARELAVRAALGGTRKRLVRQLLIESVVLAVPGGIGGLALGWTALRAAPALMPADTLPESITLSLDLRVTAFTASVTIITGVLFGLAPAWQARRLSLIGALGGGGRASTQIAGRFRSILAAGEIAIAVLLVTGAGLLLRTLASIDRVDPGFRADHVLTMRVSLPIDRYKTPDEAGVFYQRAIAEVGALPGVRAASFGGALPLDGWDIGQGFEVVGAPAVDPSHQPAAHYQIVGTQYFSVLGIPILRGRSFTDVDTHSSLPVCIVSEAFARRFLAGRDAIGARVRIDAMGPEGPTPVVREVVGVSRQVKVNGPDEREDAVEVYVPITQNPWYWASLVVKSDGEAAALMAGIRAAVARVDPNQPLTNVRTMETVAAEATARPRFRAQLIGTFAVLSVLLATVGVAGVIASTVSERRREFGIRMALGANGNDVLRLVLATACRIAVAGAALGLAGTVALTRSLESLLFGVTPLDPPTLVAAPTLLTITALAACAVPALRAARIDPAVTLRRD